MFEKYHSLSVVLVVPGQIAGSVVFGRFGDTIQDDLGVFVDQIAGIGVGGGISIHDGIPVTQLIIIKLVVFR